MKLLSYLFAIASVTVGVSASPIPDIPGYNPRLLDRRVPLEIKIGDFAEQHSIPVFYYMPRKGEISPVDIDSITQSDDLPGTTVLIAPPHGFGLRAIRESYRENIVLANGQSVIVECPQFIYYRKSSPAAKVIAAVQPTAQEQKTVSGATPIAASQIPASMKQVPSTEEASRMAIAAYENLRRHYEILSKVVRNMPEGQNKTEILLVIQDMSIQLKSGDAYAYNTDGSVSKEKEID